MLSSRRQIGAAVADLALRLRGCMYQSTIFWSLTGDEMGYGSDAMRGAAPGGSLHLIEEIGALLRSFRQRPS
jgi:hypothetical protein